MESLATDIRAISTRVLDFNNSEYASLITPVLVTLILPAALWFLTRKKDASSNEPPVAPYWIPYVGHLLDFLRDPGGLVRSLKKKYPNSPFTLIMMGTKFHVFSSPEAVSTVFSRSRDYLFHPVVASMMKNGIALPEADQPKFEVPIAEFSSDQKDSRAFVEANHAVYVKYLSGRYVDATMEVYSRHFSDVLKQLLPDSSQPAGKVIHLHEEMQKLVFFTSLSTFFGKRLQPVYPEIWEDYKLVNNALYVGVRSNLAFTLQPRAQKARSRLLAAFDRWVDTELDDWDEKDGIWNEKWGLRLNWEREALLRQHGFSLRGRSCSQASFLWVIITNAAPMTTWLLINIIQSPSLLERFRAECQQARLSDPSDPSSVRFDMAQLKSSPFVQGVWKEALRLGSASAAARVLARDVELQGYTLKRGSVVLLPVQLLHFDPDVFDDPHTFNPDRWIPGDEDDARTAQKQKRQNANLRPFGGGSGICSGRFVAEQEALLAAATLLTQCDFHVEAGQTFQLNPRSLGIMSPLRDIRVRLTRRPA
ncbi:hypothetical protein VTN96DRAFT_8886 [Rasamsonia emersonii]